MKTKLFCAAMLLLAGIQLTAQDTYKWEKIPTNDIKMKVYPADTSANAVVLADIGNITVNVHSDQIYCVFERKRRIKILKTSGFEYADVAIPLYSYQDEEVLVELEAVIYNPNGVIKTIGKKDAFWEKSNDKVTQVKFAFPEVQVGSVIEYAYVISQKSIFQLPEWYFQEEIPVRWSELTVAIPDIVAYVTLNNGAKPNKRAEVTDKGLVLSNGNGSISSVTYYMRDMPALKPEGYITTMEDYYSRLRFQLFASGIRGYREEIFSDWKKTAEELIQHESFGKRYLRKASLNEVITALTPQIQGITDQEELLKKIHAFVVSNMTWNGYNRFMAEEPLEKCFLRKKGSSAEINLLLCGLLNAFDITAHPMLLSTRKHGQVFQDYPIVDQFNYVVVQAEVGGKTILLDATNGYMVPGWINETALNGFGWVLDSKNPRWNSIQAGKSSTTSAFNLILDQDGQLRGKISLSYEGYEGAKNREKLTDEKGKGALFYKPILPLAEVASYDSVQLKNFSEHDKPLVLSAQIKIPDGLTSNGSLAYLNPTIAPFFAENPFKTTERLYPVDIPYPFAQRQIFNLTIPAGYTVEQLPQQVNLNLPNNGGKFLFLVQQMDSRIQVTSNLQINQLRYSSAEYVAIKKLFDVVIEKQQEQIVFRKKE